jgi:type IV pilus assembly protein PilC
MSKFVYEARSLSNKGILKGEIEAATEQEARIKLRAQRLVPVKITVKEAVKSKAGFFAQRIKPKDLQVMARQLATLVGSGVPILEALEALTRGSRSPIMLNALSGAISDISQGRRLAEALSNYPEVFDRLFCNMVRAGEESGNLDEILNRLSGYIEKAVKLRGKIKGAMVYPIVILTVALVVVVGLLVIVVPKFEEMFFKSGGEMPALTRMVVDFSHWLGSNWYLLVGGVIGAVYFLMNYYRTDAGRKTFDQVLIRIPYLGDLIQKGAIARFTRTLSTLLGSGVGIMEAIEISSRVVGNYVIESILARAKDSISEGKSLSVHFAKEKYMPDMVTQMIGVGEQTGNLDKMLSRIADFYEDEVDVAVTALTSIIEPLMMVGLGIIIAFLVVAMYLPIFTMAGTAGG